MFRNPLPRAGRRVLASFLAINLFALHAAAVVADDESPPSDALARVIVSATRLPTPEDEVASSVTLITAADIEAEQARTLPDILQQVPGLNIVQTGGIGGQTSLFMRGTNSNHVKIYVDGIDVANPSTPTDTFDLAHLQLADVERIEVLRGPQSGLYGSDAIGGAISIVTKPGAGPAQLVGSLEGGSFGTFNQTASLSGSSTGFNYVVNADHLRSTDTPVTPLDLLAPGEQRNPDSYDNKSISMSLRLRATSIRHSSSPATTLTHFLTSFRMQHAASQTRNSSSRARAHIWRCLRAASIRLSASATPMTAPATPDRKLLPV
jgi:vitamin B12 transporter